MRVEPRALLPIFLVVALLPALVGAIPLAGAPSTGQPRDNETESTRVTSPIYVPGIVGTGYTRVDSFGGKGMLLIVGLAGVLRALGVLVARGEGERGGKVEAEGVD